MILLFLFKDKKINISVYIDISTYEMSNSAKTNPAFASNLTPATHSKVTVDLKNSDNNLVGSKHTAHYAKE